MIHLFCTKNSRFKRTGSDLNTTMNQTHTPPIRMKRACWPGKHNKPMKN